MLLWYLVNYLKKKKNPFYYCLFVFKSSNCIYLKEHFFCPSNYVIYGLCSIKRTLIKCNCPNYYYYLVEFSVCILFSSIFVCITEQHSFVFWIACVSAARKMFEFSLHFAESFKVKTVSSSARALLVHCRCQTSNQTVVYGICLHTLKVTPQHKFISNRLILLNKNYCTCFL